jgi:aminopeptidase N
VAQLLAGAHVQSFDETDAHARSDFALPGDRPAFAPDRPADVRHVELDLALDFAERAIRGSVTTTFVALFEEVCAVTFDAAELDIDAVALASDLDTGAVSHTVESSALLAFWIEGEKLHVRLDRTYRHGESFAVRVHYCARPRIGLAFVGPTDGNPELPVQAWTLGETEYHHYWFPCHDFPNDRASTTTRVTVPTGFFALSNGRLGEIRANDNGTTTFCWHMQVPFPAYLVTLVAGEFSELSDTWRDVPVHYYVPHGREEDGRRMMGKTPAMMEYFSARFGVDYPYPKYAQVVAEMYLGAMENASATTHSYRLLNDERAGLDHSAESTVAHELVHQWHGDLIAVRDWGHTWLKEGFATYFANTWTQHEQGEDHFRTQMREELRGYLQADARGRRPIVYNVTRKNADELFDPHNYDKAACVLHLLRYVVGEEPFWRGIQLYTQRNAGREVVTADFERAMEEATGRSLARFFGQWVYRAGHPEFKVSYAWEEEQRVARLTVAQVQRVDERTPLFATPVEIAFMVPEKAPKRRGTRVQPVGTSLTTFRVQVDETQQTFYFPLPQRPLAVRFDQGGWLPKTLEFKRPAEMLRHQLTHDPDVLGRIEAAEALGKLNDAQSFAALEQALLAEPFWSVRVAIAAALGSQKSERALGALTSALAHTEHPKVRRALISALGNFRAPEQQTLAERSAAILVGVLERGDPSYYVEAAAATALGKTRTPGAFEHLVSRIDTPSWLEIIRGGIFAGLGELGDPRGAAVLTSWLLDRSRPMDARAAAAVGLWELANTKRIDQGEARTSAIEALIAALDDPWEWTVRFAISALRAWGDVRAIPALECLIERSADERIIRAARLAILRLQRGQSSSDEARRLRGDLDELRAENRALRERLAALELRLNNTPHPG